MFDFKQHYQEILKLIHSYYEINSQCNELLTENEQYKRQKEELLARFGNRYGKVGAGEARIYTEQELTQLRLELANSAGLWALIKSMLGFGKNQREVYQELMGKLNGLLNFMQNQIDNCQNEAASVLYKLDQISDQYSLAYKNVKCFGGCTSDSDWTNYTVPDTLENERIFLGDFLKPLVTEEERADLERLDEKKTLFNACREGEYLAVPWGFMLSAPVQICVDYKTRTSTGARQMLQSVIYQMLRSTPRYYMELHFMDAVTSGNDFRDFIRLQRVKKTDIAMLNKKVTGGNYQLVHSYLKNEDISAGLGKLVQRMTAVINEKASCTTVTEYNMEHGMESWIPYQVVVAQNLHEGYSDTDLKNLQYLIENGRTLGVFVIILNNEDRWEQDRADDRKNGFENCFSSEALQNLIRVKMDTDGSFISARGVTNAFWHWHTGDSHLEFIEKIAAELSSEVKLDNEFQRIFDMNSPFGQMDSTNGLHIPFAIDQRGKLLSYSLGQALNAHGLICGGTGSGKSSLLHMLISSVVMNYSPEDVELWLADYKITEFYSYKTNTPPHIRFIGLSKTSDFSYAFMDKIVEEMNRRQNIIAQADYQYKMGGGKSNITSFTDYRKVYGRNSMTRLLVIVDEFHVMSQHAQLEPDYKIKLENILSEARALGIILLLSDQAIVDGLRGLSDKGKKQIKARIALANYMDELKETLNVSDNDQLRSFAHMKVGEVAIQTVQENEDREEVATIERATAIYINGTCRYNVNEKAREIYHAADYEADVFDDRVVEPMKVDEIDEWETKYLSSHRDGSKDMQIYLGRPVDLGFALHFPLLQRKGNNMMCVSGTEDQQMRILSAVIRSFCRQPDFAVRILTDPYASVYREYKPEIVEMSKNTPEITVEDDLENICYEVCELRELLKDRGNKKKYLVIWLGLDAMADILADEKRKTLMLPPKAKVNIKKESKAAESLNWESEDWKITDQQRQDQEGLDINEEVGYQEKEETADINDLALSEFEALFGGSDFLSDISDEKDDTEDDNMGDDEKQEKTQKSYLYDARSDIARIVHLGPTCNVFNLVMYDSASALRDFREIKTLDFNHKIAFPMSDYEAGEFLEQPRLIRELAPHLGYYHNGRKGKRFIPYKL